MKLTPDVVTRMFLALIIVLLVVWLAAAAASTSGAMAVLDKLMPVLMAIVGFFFGQATARTK